MTDSEEHINVVQRLRSNLADKDKIIEALEIENLAFRLALSTIAWRVKGVEPDLGECIKLAEQCLDAADAE